MSDFKTTRTGENYHEDGIAVARPTIETMDELVNTMYGLINSHQRRQCQRMIELEAKAREAREEAEE